MTNIEGWRGAASRWQTWAAVAVVLAWVALYALTNHPSGNGQFSTGYWPNLSPSYTIPFQGAEYRLQGAEHPVAVARDQLVLLGQHDGVTFYARPSDQQGGGGGEGVPVYQQIYVQDGVGKYVPLQRGDVDPRAGRFMP